MDINIYRTYSFAFDPRLYAENFTKALRNAGIEKPAQFHRLLENTGIKDYDYESIKSYFYGRRVPPLNVFIAVCKSLHLCADEIAFPQAVQNPEFNKDITCWEDWFRDVFWPYNLTPEDELPSDLTEFFVADTYKSNVDTLALVLSRYNYLIQKYHYADVSADEFGQIFWFTHKYILDRQKGAATDPETVMEWIRNCEHTDFLAEFYNQYTIGFYGKTCCSLLQILGTAIPKEFIRYAAQLLPEQDLYLEIKL